jgi:hypothetical protein
MRAFILVLISAFFIQPLYAEIYNGPISAAMGGTGRAGIGSSEGAFVNPATIPLIKGYEFVGSYRDGYARDGQQRNGWMIGVVDNHEDVMFPGTIHYGRTSDTGRGPGRVRGELVHAAGAYLINNYWSVGASVYRLSSKIDLYPGYTQWNGSIGTVYLLNENISLAYVLDNLAKPGSDVPKPLREDMRQSVGFFGRVADVAVLRVDVARSEKLNPDKRLVYMLGFESATSEFMVFRAGYRLDDQHNQRFWTAGLGFNGPRLRIDYSFEKGFEESSGALHSVDMRLPF